jgi:hypothetical protein
MKNEQEKSDLFIVAMKPADKPGQPEAEPVEPRARTEGNTEEEHTWATGGGAGGAKEEDQGNTGEQHTCRTLRLESVSQRLDRVRGAACELLC